MNKTIDNQIDTKEKEQCKVFSAKGGRPSKPGREKASITLPAGVKTQLKIYCVENKIALSDLIEGLSINFLQNKYERKLKKC